MGNSSSEQVLTSQQALMEQDSASFVCVPSERRPRFSGITTSGHIALLQAKRVCQQFLPSNLWEAGSLLPLSYRFSEVLPFSTCQAFKTIQALLLLIVLLPSLSATKLLAVAVNKDSGPMKSLHSSESAVGCLTQHCICN